MEKQKKPSAEIVQFLIERFREIRAVVFDKDGILVNSEQYHDKAHREALAEAGVAIDRTFYIHHGVSTEPRKFYAQAFSANGRKLTDDVFASIRTRKKEIYAQLVQAGGIIPIEPAIDIARILQQQGIPLAVCFTGKS